MGVRGLTTFIARNSDKYLEYYELHDTYLVIDGNNLAAQLYKWHAKCYDCFGGDYNEYARTIVHFFQMLKQSNVTPLIIFDGGYEDRKLKTIYSRMKSRIRQARDLNCATEGTIPVFPLFLREVFVELILKLRLKTVRCIVEADYEMACIARTLNCPVLSYDSDFYIFDVLYVPFSTIDMKCTKIKDSVKGSYNCMQCRIYKLDKLLKSFGGLKKENIPLLGTLLGNDYIKANVFNNFYEHIKLAKRKYAQTDQQRRIAAVIKWLQNETYESAVRKILGRIKIVNRTDVAKQIQFMTDGYRCSESQLIKYLDVECNNVQTSNSNKDLRINLEELYDMNVDVDDELSKEVSENSDSTGSDSNLSLGDTAIQDVPVVDGIPNFFEENYQRCLYPACFMDICSRNRYFFVPQIENYENIPSHDISLNILSAIYKILSINNAKQLKYIIRSENAGLRNLYLDKSSKELPTLYNLTSIGIEEASDYFHDVLETSTSIRNILIKYPSSWRLYMLSVIYWIQHVQPKVTTIHMYSILLSAVILKASQHLPASKDSIEETVKLSKSEKIVLMQNIKRYFQMDIKLRKNPKLFNVDIVDSFAQFQSCALHIKYLNTLLSNPLEDYVISDFYNGTLIYNFYNDIINRNDVNTYINLLLKDSPSILNAVIEMTRSLSSILPDSFEINIGSKKRKKRRKKVHDVTHEDIKVNSNEDSTIVYDVNNKFSLLAFC